MHNSSSAYVQFGTESTADTRGDHSYLLLWDAKSQGGIT